MRKYEEITAFPFTHNTIGGRSYAKEFQEYNIAYFVIAGRLSVVRKSALNSIFLHFFRFFIHHGITPIAVIYILYLLFSI